jgi:uncharacterized protein YndB with AHSA1/START domain
MPSAARRSWSECRYKEAVSAWRQQAVIDAPVTSVWSLVGDPARYPEWAADVVSVTGLAEVADGATFEQTQRMPLFGADSTTFEIERLEDLREIRLRCRTSGYYSHWILTSAQDTTFLDVEIGVEAVAPQYRLYFGALGKRYFRRVTEQSIEGVRRALAPARA